MLLLHNILVSNLCFAPRCLAAAAAANHRVLVGVEAVKARQAFLVQVILVQHLLLLLLQVEEVLL
jgi:hypothetical protein